MFRGEEVAAAGRGQRSQVGGWEHKDAGAENNAAVYHVSRLEVTL
jgi:hypothetical protein